MDLTKNECTYMDQLENSVGSDIKHKFTKNIKKVRDHPFKISTCFSGWVTHFDTNPKKLLLSNKKK